MEKKKLNIILIWFVIIFTLQLTVGLKSLNAQFSLNNPLNISEDVEQIDLVDVPTRITDQVLILFVDGMRYDKMLEANTPNMDALRANGTTFSNYFCEYPSYSTVNYAAFSTGSSTNYTSVFANAFNEELALPTLYSLIDDPEINKSVITGSNSWMKFFGSFAEVAVKVEAEGYHTLDEGEQIMEAVIQTVPGNFSNIQFIGFEDVDAAGHEVGAASPVYTETIEQIDVYIGEILDLYHSLNQLENTTIILFSDHGHADVGGHGANTYNQTHATLILAGKGITNQGLTAIEKVRMNSPTPTVLSMLGIPLAPTMNGKVLYDYIDTTTQHDAIYAIQSAEIMVQQTNATLNKIGIFSSGTKQLYRNHIASLKDNITNAKSEYSATNYGTAFTDAKEITKLSRSLLSVMMVQFNAAKRLTRALIIIGSFTITLFVVFFLKQRKVIEICHQHILKRNLLLPEVITAVTTILVGIIVFASFGFTFSATGFNSVGQVVPPIMITFGLQLLIVIFMPWLMVYLMERKKQPENKKFKDWRPQFLKASIGSIFFVSFPTIGYIIYAIISFGPWPNWYFPPIGDAYAIMIISIMPAIFYLIAMIQQFVLIGRSIKARKTQEIESNS